MSWNIVCISAWVGDRGYNTFDFVWDRRFMEQILSIKMNPESWSETKQWPIKHLTDIAGKNLIVPMQWMHSRSEIPTTLLLLPAVDRYSQFMVTQLMVGTKCVWKPSWKQKQKPGGERSPVAVGRSGAVAVAGGNLVIYSRDICHSQYGAP